MPPDVAHVLHDATRALAAAGVDAQDARLEGEVLLAYALGVTRARVLASLREPLDDAGAARFSSLLARRRTREPLSYIIGEREFYGLSIAASPHVLIPRPESELLVEIAMEACQSGKSRVADVGTGSGCLAIAIALHAPGTRIDAIDASPDALGIARQNAERHGVVDRLTLRKGDLLEGVGIFDVIVANLPYVGASEWAALAPEVRDFEPREALVGGPRGTEAIERLLVQAPQHLAQGGVLAMEIGMTQGAAVSAAARRAFPEAEVCVRTDLAGHDRVVLVRRVGRTM